MTWLRKTRILWALALALVIATIIGAKSLTGGNGGPDANGKPAVPAMRGGPVVLGLVDTDPPPVGYGLPPVLASGTVTVVHVKDGDEVKAGQPLYEFDATIQKADVEKAKAAIEYAKTLVKVADEGVKQHTASVKRAENAVKAAEREVNLTQSYYKLVEKTAETFYRTERIPEADWPDRKKSDPNLYKANVDYDTAMSKKDLAEQARDQLKTADPTVKVKEADAAVKQADAELAKAKSAVELCVVRAKTDGTVEQVTIGPGTTIGVGTRGHALWLIPNGPRVVRAEVEAEFAHRVGVELVGKTVTIFDHTDPKLTYTGVVRRVPPVFLLKRATSDNFLGGDTRVIEVPIEVTDPFPAGKPPLRIGQRVRVNLGQ